MLILFFCVFQRMKKKTQGDEVEEDEEEMRRILEEHKVQLWVAFQKQKEVSNSDDSYISDKYIHFLMFLVFN